MATLIPETYTTRFGGLPGTTALISSTFNGWIATTWDDFRRCDVTLYRNGSGFAWGLHGAHPFRTAQQAADAAERALWL